MKNIAIGDIVKAHYNSGTYIGKVLQDRGERFLVEVFAVVKHPLQGDLHNLSETENVFFHERKALAHHEKVNVKKPAVHTYNEEIPDYKTSLSQAITTYREKLKEKDSRYNELALQALSRLEEEVYSKIL